MKKKTKAFSKVIAFILVILLLFAGIGLIYKFTNGFNENFKTFYVEYNGKQILAENSEIELFRGQSYLFDVHYTFDRKDSERGYSVRIVPNSATDFDFTVDGELYSWSGDVPELSDVFRLKKENTCFSFYIRLGMTLQTVLDGLYAGKNIKVANVVELEKQSLYTLVVSSYNENVVYKINFAMVDPFLSFDNAGIVF